jgi:predicted phosphohydrolase
MTIAYTSDIHIDNSKENSLLPGRILDILMENIPDVFLLAGDISHFSRILEQTLAVFKPLSCTKAFVPGNHDIWIEKTCPDSYRKYMEDLPVLAKRNGFIPLWIEPFVQQDYGFCGSMGWYDFSFKDTRLHEPLDVYKEKMYRGFTWTDKIYARFMTGDKQMGDEEITRLLFSFFSRHYEEISDKSKKIIALFHHIPFRGMLKYRSRPEWNFFHAYMGASCFGDFLLEKQKTELVICGHSHQKHMIEIPRQTGEKPVKAVASPFGYFRSDGLKPVQRWCADRVSFIEIE